MAKAINNTAKKPAKVGRPSKYTPELATQICSELAQGKSLRTVCLAEGMPALSSVFLWLRENKDFSEQYARAKEESADALFEETMDIADESIEVVRNAPEKKSGAMAQVQRLRVDTRKWMMSKMKPKKYGDILDLRSLGEKLPAPIYGGLSTTKGHDSDKEAVQPEEEN